jgi:sugar phosphate isomerase/epimerase
VTGARRLSQAISEGDGISIIALVGDASSARAAEQQGAEGLALRATAPGIREATSLPIFYRVDATPEAARDAEITLHAMVEAFAPHHMNVGDLQSPGDLAPIDVIAERFAGVCDRAAEHGTRVALEFLPWTGLGDLSTAAQVVHAADRPNGGLLIDAWHYFRGQPDPSSLRALRAHDVVSVQLDDADPDIVGPLYEDTMFRRRLPGEGTFDLVGLVQTLDAIGVDVPYSVEIMSTLEQSLPVEEAARRAHDATSTVLTRARGIPS